MPALITFFVKLIGPFASYEAADQVPLEKLEDTGPVVATAQPIQIDNRMDVTRTSMVPLSPQAVAGYYVLFEKISQQGNGAVIGSCILRIMP